MLMIPHTHPSAHPRLTTARIMRQSPAVRITAVFPQATVTERLLTRTADSSINARPQSLLAPFTRLARAPAPRSPCHEVVTLHRFGPRALELHHELAQEFRMPVVFVRLEKLVGLLVGEEIQDERAQR